jgi:hypothetical protein
VAPPLDEPARVEDEDLVRGSDRRHAMPGDDPRDAAEPFELAEDRSSVEESMLAKGSSSSRTGGRISSARAGTRAGAVRRERVAALADRRVVAAGQIAEIGGEPGAAAGVLDLGREAAGRPSAMLSASDIENRNDSCGTSATVARRAASSSVSSGASPMKTARSGTG